jgi:hypothetical protein
MIFELNIGLDSANPLIRQDQRLESILSFFRSENPVVFDLGGGDNPERTVWVRVETPLRILGIEQFVYLLAVKWDQEAIACRLEDGSGFLAGPKAAAWGSFNPDFFVRP